MRMKLITSTAASLVLASMSMAQAATDTETTTGAGPAGTAGSGMMSSVMDWDQDVADAFFTDDTRVTLRSESEIESNWEDLDDDQRQTVRDFCDQNGDDEETDDATGDATGERSGTDADIPVETDDTEPDDVGADMETDTDADADDDTGMGMSADVSMSEICDMVEDL